jgi:S-adenosylmethionine-diacylglycerol 3-amino-3-carboxypropyl transferase
MTTERAARAPSRARTASLAPLERLTLAGARSDRLFFAQVREDPILEIEALAPAAGETIVVVGSGGCTALSLLAAGAGRVVSVDLNSAQNHLVELKAAAVAWFGDGAERAGSAARGASNRPVAAGAGATHPGANGGVVAFLGGAAAAPAARIELYRQLREALSPPARDYWDRRQAALARGVLGSGVSERFIGLIAAAIRNCVHGRARIRRLLACETLAEQRDFYAREWNNRRWRLLFQVLLNRWVFHKTYDPAFFRNVQNPSFSRHFHALAAHVLTDLPIATNYFVHEMLTGTYPAGVPGGLPPYLEADAGPVLAAARYRLSLVDGSYIDFLRSCTAKSLHGYALSNICEWLTPAEIDTLFAEIVRTAVPGARLVFRNFVGWNEVPDRWRRFVVEDRARGDALILRDRSAVQRRIAVCRIEGDPR